MILLIVFALITFGFLYPFVYILALSFNDAADAVQGGIYFFPRKFSIESYKAVFKNDQLLNAYGITILRTLIGTFTSVLATGMFGYGLSKSKLMFRKVYFNPCSGNHVFQRRFDSDGYFDQEPAFDQ